MKENRVIHSKNIGSQYSLKQDFFDFINFMKSNIGLVLANVFFILLTYGLKLFQYSVSIDTEIILNDQECLLISWIGIGRYGLVLLKYILGTTVFTPYVATFLMLSTLLILNMFLCFSFKYFYLGNLCDDKKFKVGLFLFSAVFVTFPTLAEQFNFLLQGFEDAVAMFLSVISAFLLLKWSVSKQTKENMLYVLIGLIILVISVASYQSILFFCVSVATAFIILFCVGKREDTKNISFWSVSFKLGCVFLLSIFLYFVSNFVVNIFYPKNDYLDDKILWGKLPIAGCFDIVCFYFKQVFLGGNIFFTRYFLVFTIMLVFIILSTKVNYGHKSILLLCLFVFIISPFMQTFCLGNVTEVRAQIMLPFVFAVECMIILIAIDNVIIKNCVMVLCLYIAINQSYVVNKLFYCEQMKYEEDVAIANDIATRVGKLGYGEVPDKPIVFIGIHRPKEGSINFRGEVLGHSFWEWDGDMIGRKMGLMKVLGYSYMAPSEQQIIKARDLSKNTPCFPSEGCVVDFRDFIVVKLSD